MMNHLTFKVLLAFGLFASSTTFAQTGWKTEPIKTMEQRFRVIPDSQRLGVYWYWMNGNISKEGVVRDLEAMKRAGINRAYIGHIGGGQGVPEGKVKIFSDEWWDILHTALATATKLNIEIGLFNCPGWSQSGGPWIKPNQSMRYLACSKVTVTGPSAYHQKLPEVGRDAQDVKLIAYPAPEAKVNFHPVQDLKKASTIDLVSEQPAVVRSLTIQTVLRPVSSPAELFVKEGDAYRSVCKFVIDRSNAAINVGFEPYPPIVISLPEVKGSQFRLVLSDGAAGMIDKVELSDVPRVERYPEKTFAKMFQTPHPMWYDYLWKEQPAYAASAAIVPADRVMDITKYMDADGMLQWQVPKGKWIIMRTAMMPTGSQNAPASDEATGLEVDKMSAAHVREHFDAFMGKIMERIPEADRKSLKVTVEDSYETGGQNWTDAMIPDFEKQYGYSPVPYLPVFNGVVVGSEDQSDRFLWDVRRLVADKVSYEYVGGLRQVSHEHGLTTWLENYGHWGYPGEFMQYGSQSDEIAGEFWSAGDLGDIENRSASSCGHVYGKQKVWAESFTCGGPDFSRYPGEMKLRGDRFFTEGINSTLLHLYIEQPDERVPGINANFGNEFNRHNTWFSQLDVFARYLKRCNYMLQQGQYVADVAYFLGEDAPKMTGVRTPEIPKGYSYDYINGEALLLHASVIDGRLTLESGMQYRVLVLPQLRTMRPELLRKLKNFVAEGLVILGPAPEYSPSLQGYPQADEEVKALAKELWQPSESGYVRFSSYGKGRVYQNTSLEEIFADLGVVPDFHSADPCDPLLFIHRHLADGETYFVSNQSDRTLTFDASFRVQGLLPELWNPQTEEVRLLSQYKPMTQTTQVPMALAPYESAFVVFRSPAGGTLSSGKNYPDKQLLLQVTTPWTVTFESGRGGPEAPVTFDSLADWSTNSDLRIRYFSGTAVYRNRVKLPKLPAGQLYLDLGKVMVMAKVKINGQYAGGVWTAPYRLNITPYIHKGTNDIEVEVVNNWCNRLIGEKSLPEKDRFTFQTATYLQKDTPLQPSGLLGPVEIQCYDYQMLK